MSEEIIVKIDETNIDQYPPTCFLNPKNEGYLIKRDWIKKRLSEGLIIKQLYLENDGKCNGFIEYIPGEKAWRAVNAPGYMFIHCLWIVGKSKGQGFSGILLDECIKDAKAAGMNGVAMVTSERVWLAGKKLLLKHGFESVEEAQPFNLMVKKFKDGSVPSFCGEWEQKASRFGKGFTVLYSSQCPYIPDATKTIIDFAKKRGMQFKAVELKSCREIRENAPSPYGVFCIVFNGRLLSYYYLLPKDLDKMF